MATSGDVSPDADISPAAIATIQEMYANQARYRSTQKGAAILRTFPVLFVALLVVFIYTVYAAFHLIPLFEVGIDDLQKGTLRKGIFQTTTFHILFMLFAVSYILSVITPPGSIPDTPEWTDQGAGYSQSLHGQVLETKRESGRRYCKWCMKFKPDRCHHCRQCRRCVLKMDHHCPWIYNCVGWGNHKYFILTLVYASLTLLFVFGTQLESVKSAVEEPQIRFGVVMLLLLSELFTGLFAIICTLFFGFHWWLISHNLSTIEFCEKHFRRSPHQSLYNRGCGKNFLDAFGYNPLLWCLPIDNRYGDGLYFTAEVDDSTREDLLPNEEASDQG